jgi:hypothetical protein
MPGSNGDINRVQPVGGGLVLESRKTGGGTRSGQVARQSDTKVDRSSSEAQLTAPNRQSPRLEVMEEKRSRLLCSFRDEECKQLHKAIVLRKCLDSQEPDVK